jgi:hypothetical protein
MMFRSRTNRAARDKEAPSWVAEVLVASIALLCCYLVGTALSYGLRFLSIEVLRP